MATVSFYHSLFIYMCLPGMHTKNYSDVDDETEHMLNFLRAQQKALLHNNAYARGEASFANLWNNLIL